MRPTSNRTKQQWLDSGEYLTEVDAALTSIVRNAEYASSEAETAAIFEREVYYIIRTNLDYSIPVTKEKTINGILHTFGTSHTQQKRGRLDAIINNLVVEYKHFSKLQSAHDIQKAFMQVEEYLRALYTQQRVKYDAILTDGISIAYFSFNGEVIVHTPLKLLTTKDLDTIIKAILNNKTKKFTPTNIIKDFSISSKSDSASKDIARILFLQLTEHLSEKSEMLYTEWKGLMHLSVEDNGRSRDIEKRRHDLSSIFNKTISDTEAEYKGLFALQTTYAIIVKLIACKVVDRLNFNADALAYADLTGLPSDKLKNFFQKMEDGYAYSSMGIRNFLEGDFFSWYADDSQWGDEFFYKIKEIMNTISQYSAFTIEVVYSPIDVFKDLYMSIIPQSVRHSMGEYFTPEWLADSVISKAIELIGKDDWKAIDPCCGSGIFIISLIKRIVGKRSLHTLSNEERQRLLDEILSRVHGIDINPLSVLSARVSYFTAIHQLGTVQNIEIPVFLGDSAIIPQKEEVDGFACYSYMVKNSKYGSFDIILPARMVQKTNFGKMMNQLQALVKTDNSDILYNVLTGELTEEERSSEKLLKHIRSLAESLVLLHKNKWDGIWIRIATNFMMIARLSSYELIVGNPPWVKWEHLPTAYTRRIKEFCDIRHIFCNDGGMFGGAQLNICALISNVTATNWLKRDGIQAFLMPDSLMSQNSYEEFRNFHIRLFKTERLYLQALDRWKAPLRPFKVGGKSVMQDFNTYYYGSKMVDYTAGVPVREISRKQEFLDNTINQCSTFEEAIPFLTLEHSCAKQLSSQSTAFTYISAQYDYTPIIGPTFYYYRTGVESTPFEVFKLLGVGKSTQPGHYRFKNKVLKTSRYKVDDIPLQGWDFPTELIYPMVEGPSVSPFKYDCGQNFHLIPYSPQNTKEPIPLTVLAERQPEIAAYFADHKHLLDMQSGKSKTMHRGNEFYALSKIGRYTFAPHMVAARDNSKFCAAVIHPTLTPWGELKQSICVKHTIIISQDKNGNFISEDEAHYINGVLNSSIVVSYIHSTFKTNGFSLNKSHIFLPKYKKDNPLFQTIASLSKEATNRLDKCIDISNELAIAYLNLCKALNPQFRQ